MKNLAITLLLISSVVCFARITVLEETPNHLRLEVDASDYQIQDGTEFSSISLPGWPINEDPGAPALPSLSIPVAIPPAGSISVTISSQQTSRHTLAHPYLPAPRITEDEKTQSFNYIPAPDKFRATPTSFISQDAASRYRFLQYIPINIFPVLYNHATHSVTIAEKLVLDITIHGNTALRSRVATTDFDAANEAFFINYNTAKQWKTLFEKPRHIIPFSASDYWYKIVVDQPGTYALDAKALDLLPSFTDPALLRLFTVVPQPDGSLQLQQVPLSVPATSRLDASSQVLFQHAVATDSPQHYYWLVYGGSFSQKPLRTVLEPDFAATPIAFSRKQLTRHSRRETAQCLIIHPAEFLSQSQELADIHQRNYGVSSILADQQDMFDAFSGGIPRPESIQDSIHAVLLAHPELKYVVLMGSGTEDWDNPTEKNKIMVYDYYDDSFVDFDNNVSPELSIGRLPAQNSRQMNLMIDHIRNYVENPTPGYWRNTLLFTADDENKSGGFEGIGPNGANGLNHTLFAEQTSQLMDPGVYIRRIYGLEYEFDEYNNKPDARNDIIQQVNDGCLVWYFIGHGNEDVLGDEEYFRASLHLPLLENSDKLNLFIAASCSVGKFYDAGFDCMAEKIVMLENGGSIASIAASWNCGGRNNTLLMKHFLTNLINERETLGISMLEAKLVAQPETSYVWNSRLYHVFGDPVLQILPPLNIGGFTNVPQELQPRQLVELDGELGGLPYSGDMAIHAYDSIYHIDYTNVLPSDTSQVYTVQYTKPGNRYFFGNSTANSGNFSTRFIVPDDARDGTEGKLDGYLWDAASATDYLVSQDEVNISNIPIDTLNTQPPVVHLWLETETFQSGDIVSTSPQVIAAISDENGVNIAGTPGHRILLILDNSTQPIDATAGFTYDPESCTEGTLHWQLNNLETGPHSLQLICFDNFNNPTIQEVAFTSVVASSVSIHNMLPYPNPMKDDGYFTFSVPGDTSDLIDITVMIFTITGRKVRTLHAYGREVGYNQVYWDGRDGDGDRLANNTYFYKVKVKRHSDNKRAEKTGKVIVLK